MKTAGTILGLVIMGAMIWYLTKAQLSLAPPPPVTLNEAGIRNDLLTIAHAEKMYMASHGSYASLQEIQGYGSLTFTGLRWGGYLYTSEVEDGHHFRIAAKPTDVSKAIWPTFSIDETMQISEFAFGGVN